MDNALASLIQSAAGTGAPTNPSSRYYGAAVNTYTRSPMARRWSIWRGASSRSPLSTSRVQNYAVVEDDRSTTSRRVSSAIRCSSG